MNYTIEERRRCFKRSCLDGEEKKLKKIFKEEARGGL